MAKSKASREAAKSRKLFGPRYTRRLQARQRRAQEFNDAQASHDPARFLDAVQAVDGDPWLRRVTGRWLRKEHHTHLAALRVELQKRLLLAQVQKQIDAYADALPEADGAPATS